MFSKLAAFRSIRCIRSSTPATRLTRRFSQNQTSIATRAVAGGLFFWFSSTFCILAWADFMRYRRTVNALYGKGPRNAMYTVNRAAEIANTIHAIKDPNAMHLFYGKNSVGKSYLFSMAGSLMTEPVLCLEIENPYQFMMALTQSLKYNHDQNKTLKNFFEWNKPAIFNLAAKQKRDFELEDILQHLRNCQKWLKRVQNYPWNKAMGRYQGNINVVLDSFDRFLTFEVNTPQNVTARQMAQTLIRFGKSETDSDGIRMNFVFSDGSLKSFQAAAGSGAWKRMIVQEIHEIGQNHSVGYMMNRFQGEHGRQIEKSEAKAMYEVCGGLFADMRDMVAVAGNIDEFKAKKYGDFSGDFVKLGLLITPRDKSVSETKLAAWNVLKIAAADGEVGFGTASDILMENQDMLDALAGKDGPLYFVPGEYPKYQLTSLPMSNYVKKVIGECEHLLTEGK